MRSEPEYTTRHAGTAIVCGPAPSLFDDIHHCLAIVKRATFVAVNEGLSLITADILVTVDMLFAKQARRYAEEVMPAPVTIHAKLKPLGKSHGVEGVDYWWHDEPCLPGSGWWATRWALAVGFDRVVLCGCPMDAGSGYHPDVMRRMGRDAGQVDGYEDARPAREHVARKFQPALRDAVARGEGFRVYSMSGFTRELLGEPYGNR